VSFDEARMILRMSEGTLRREIKAGRVTAEKRRRNPDSPTDLREVYEVLVTDPSAVASQSESAQAPDTRHDAPAITERALAILDTVLRANAETMDRQAARIDQYAEMMRQEMERRVRAEAERDTLRERITDLAQLAAERQAELEELRDRERRPWWKWWE
jgi:hypothetical protein